MSDVDNKKAKQIIKDIVYITLATASKSGKPWNTPTFAAFDKEYNFYWHSGKYAQHAQNIKENSDIFIVVYDSTKQWGHGKAVYIRAKAKELGDREELEQALIYLNKRTGEEMGSVEKFLGTAPRRVYKAIPKQIWMNKNTEIDDRRVDIRVEIDLGLE